MSNEFDHDDLANLFLNLGALQPPAELHGYAVGFLSVGGRVERQAWLKHCTELLDIEMPKVDGFEVATFIRNNERVANLPIIMITSRSGDKHRERAEAIGVNRYLIKPYQEQQLISELRDVMTEA